MGIETNRERAPRRPHTTAAPPRAHLAFFASLLRPADGTTTPRTTLASMYNKNAGTRKKMTTAANMSPILMISNSPVEFTCGKGSVGSGGG